MVRKGIMENENLALIEINKAQQALERANDIHEIIDLRDKSMAFQILANARGFKDAAQEAKIYQLKAERKAGDWLAENVENPRNLQSQDATEMGLPDGIDKYESSRWQQEAKVSEEQFTDWIDDCLSTGKEITAVGLRHLATGLHVSDDSYEWNTPREYIEAARKLMGSIDLDPASSDEAQSVVNAKSFYTKEIDGLSQSWFGNVWLNPPYNMPLIEQFVNHIIRDYRNNNIESAVVLTNNSTDTGWFHSLLNYPVCLTRGRIKFWSGNETLATRQGQALFYLGDNIATFTDLFNNFGVVLTKL